MSLSLSISKKDGLDVYQYFWRNKLLTHTLPSFINKINGKTIEEAAKELGVWSVQLLIILGHLKKAGYIKEVIIK